MVLDAVVAKNNLVVFPNRPQNQPLLELESVLYKLKPLELIIYFRNFKNLIIYLEKRKLVLHNKLNNFTL
jgi:hypothetical protein